MRYISPLTGLRFLAAALVFLHHLKFFFKTDTHLGGWLTKYVFHEGFIGVGFFFMLSGFILAHRYDGADFSHKGPGLRNYFAARIARIYPLHLLTLLAMLLIGVLLAVPVYDRFWISLLTNLSLTHSFVPDYQVYFSFNSAAWSLSDELFFYALFPFVVALKRNWFNCLLILCAVAVVVPALFWHLRYAAWVFYAFPPARFVDFMIGIALYRMLKSGLSTTKHSFARGFAAEAVAVAMFSLALWFYPQVPAQLRYGCYYWLPIALLIRSQVLGGGPIARLMSTRPFVYLGSISFAFYMVHVIVLTLFKETLATRLHLSWFHTSLLAFAITTAIAVVVYHVIEVPLNRVLRRRLSSTDCRVARLESEGVQRLP
jgi:peptidoglycan/LPS O-acetylase OafA/YrhL